MKILPDTHITLCAILKPDILPTRAQDILLSKDNEVFYSFNLGSQSEAFDKS